MSLPQSNQGILLVIGAVFFLIGMLGGGFEISAIKVPSVGKWPRLLLSILGTLFMLSGLILLIIPTPGAQAGGTAFGNSTAGNPSPTPPPTDTRLAPTATPNPTSTPVPASPTPAAVPSSSSQSLPEQGAFQDISLEFNVVQFEQKGMRIHAKFTVDGLKGVPSQAEAYFYYADGTKLMSNTTGYKTPGGQASTWATFTPGYDSTKYDDFVLFMPYSAFDTLQSGKYQLKLNVQLWDLRNSSNPPVAASDFVPFQYELP